MKHNEGFSIEIFKLMSPHRRRSRSESTSLLGYRLKVLSRLFDIYTHLHISCTFTTQISNTLGFVVLLVPFLPYCTYTFHRLFVTLVHMLKDMLNR